MGEPFYQPNNEVLLQSYWGRPENKNTGDADVSTIYLAVGEALTHWEFVENTLEQLFCDVTETRRSSASPAKRAFGAVESGGLRRKMILSAAEAYFGVLWEDNEIRRAFTRVTDAVGFASSRRDDIAHGTAHNFRGGPPYGGFGAFLLPPGYNTQRTKSYAYDDGSDPMYFTFTDFRYTSADIREFTSKFKMLNQAVGYLTGFVRKLDDGTILLARAVKGVPFVGS